VSAWSVMASSTCSAGGEPAASAAGLTETSTTTRSVPSVTVSVGSAGRRAATLSARRLNTYSGRSSTPSAPCQVSESCW
jgi:hypothetical protein